MDYKNSGVDIEAGYKSVELMKEHVKETMRPEVLGWSSEVSQEHSHLLPSRIWRIRCFYREQMAAELR